ncbi:nucleoside-diphosphate kinase, partial [Desulfovibrio sp.]|uniref:nucleoside-diphosphate kinase n=1 Tax=Desulfovibrio sp. TaxID=885 RepID=UPI0039E2DD4A
MGSRTGRAARRKGRAGAYAAPRLCHIQIKESVMMQSTFAIIKPDAVSSLFTGEILAAMEAAGLKIVALKRLHLSKDQAA